MPLFANGRFNRCIGWTMLLAGLASTSLFDPWIFAERDPDTVTSAWRIVRQTQGVLLAMALLQLAVGTVLPTGAIPGRPATAGSILTGVGAMLYAVGYLLLAGKMGGGWLIIVGSIINLLGFFRFLLSPIQGRYADKLLAALPIICFGMLLDLAMGLFNVAPETFLPSYLGTPDETPLRMMRLARVAVIALSVISLSFFDLVDDQNRNSRLVVLGGRLLIGGTIGMPLILVLSAVVWMQFKYLLSLPAMLVASGAVIALVLAHRRGDGLKKRGWLLISLSTLSGLVIGMYAFDGPLPAPSGMEQYQAIARRAIRIAHAYAVALGLVHLFLSERLKATTEAGGTGVTSVREKLAAASGWILTVASVVTLIALLAIVHPACPTWILFAGPAGAALATAVGLSLQPSDKPAATS